MKYSCLLGSTSDLCLVFADFGVTLLRDGRQQFTASFRKVRPFNGDLINLTDYYMDWLDDMDCDTKYRLCEEYDCSPSLLAEYLANDCCDVRDVIDCSLYPELYVIDCCNWYFLSESCGQYDSRAEMNIVIHPAAYDELHALWDMYHLKWADVDETVASRVEKLYEALSQVDEQAWITGFIQAHQKELEDSFHV